MWFCLARNIYCMNGNHCIHSKWWLCYNLQNVYLWESAAKTKSVYNMVHNALESYCSNAIINIQLPVFLIRNRLLSAYEYKIKAIKIWPYLFLLLSLCLSLIYARRPPLKKRKCNDLLMCPFDHHHRHRHSHRHRLYRNTTISIQPLTFYPKPAIIRNREIQSIMKMISFVK